MVTIVVWNRVVLVRWDSLAAGDIERVAETVRRRHAELQQPLLYVTAIGPDAPVPSSAQREAFRATATELMKITAHAFIAIEGDRLKHKFIRTSLTGMLMLARSRVSIFRTVQAIAQPLALALDLDPAELHKVLASVGPKHEVGVPRAGASAPREPL